MQGFWTRHEQQGDCLASWYSGTSSVGESGVGSKLLRVSYLGSEGRDLSYVSLTWESMKQGVSEVLKVTPDLACTADGVSVTNVNDAVLFGGICVSGFSGNCMALVASC